MLRAGIVAALLLLAGCAGDAGYRALPDAVQRPHPHTVPHTDRQGVALSAYDPLRISGSVSMSHSRATNSRPPTSVSPSPSVSA